MTTRKKNQINGKEKKDSKQRATANSTKKKYSYQPLTALDLKSLLGDYTDHFDVTDFEEELIAYATCAEGTMYCV